MRYILKHLGIVEGTLDTAQADGTTETRHMMVKGPGSYCFAPNAGLFEPVHVVGQQVRAGDPAGWLHFIEDVDRAPHEVSYGADGILWMSAGPGRVARGDTVAVVMQDYEPA